MLQGLTVETGYAGAVKVGEGRSRVEVMGASGPLLGTVSPGKRPMGSRSSRTALMLPTAMLDTVLRDPRLDLQGAVIAAFTGLPSRNPKGG